jgi:hypothetical protein
MSGGKNFRGLLMTWQRGEWRRDERFSTIWAASPAWLSPNQRVVVNFDGELWKDHSRPTATKTMTREADEQIAIP